MAVELEAKVKVPDHDVVRQKLLEAGAVSRGVTMETNRFFDDAGGRLKAGDSGLRVRTNANAERGSAGHVVTFKGPRQPGAYKTREEIEFTVDDPAAATAVFARLGYPLNMSFEKRRESYELGGCKVELDTLPAGLGTYVEVEGETEQKVAAVLDQLGLVDEPVVTDSYASMIGKHLTQTGAAAREVKFA
ncbi:MAG TPA: class IV adenylate cyclase [Humisphaera sp.]